MIAWWGWLLIWTGLVLGLLVMLGLFAWWLFRKSLVALDDLSDLAEKTSILDVDDARIPTQQRSVLLSMREVLDREDARRAHRAERKAERRERRLARAKRITTADVQATQWPAAFTTPRPPRDTGYHGETRTQQKTKRT